MDVAQATNLHVFAALLAGGQLVLADPGAGDEDMLDGLERSRASVMSALPRHYEGLVRAARGRGRPVHGRCAAART
jgi:hypothetical protein